MQFMPPFTRWLRQQRKTLGLTQAELAQRSHYAAITLRKVEEGRLKPSREMTLQLAKGLDIPDDALDDFVAFARGMETRRALRLLPLAGAPIIDRQNELGDVAGLLLRDDVRLVTLLGSPGVGKTRLAIELGHKLTDEFADGVCLVPLAEVRHAGDVAPAIATMMSVRVPSRESASQALIDWLQSAELLLILDNFEHVLDAASLVNDLLMAAPYLTVLATSRAPLDVIAEHRYEVRPLAVPAQNDDATSQAVCPSVQLFVQRAQSMKPAFTLTPANLKPVAEVCAQLEGLPLAIELAAGRTTMFTPRTLASRLRAHSADVLTLSAHDTRDAPSHHKTLQSTIAWSYNLLDAEAQRIFRCMGVFAGGFSLAAAEAVCGGLPTEAGDPMTIVGDDESFLRSFETLLNHNLIRQISADEDELRFDMLETLREFALEKLAECGETTPAHDRHASYYAQLADAIFFGRPASEDAQWARRLRAERANLQAALSWRMAQTDNIEQELLLSAVVNHAAWVGVAVWGMQSSNSGIEDWLNHIESEAVSNKMASIAARGKALHGMLERATHEHDDARIRRLQHIFLQLYFDSGNPRLIWFGWICKAFLVERQGDLAGALALYQKACECARKFGQRDSEAGALGATGVIAFSLGDDAQAESNFKAAIAIYRELGIEWCFGVSLPDCLSQMALIAQARHDPAASLILLEEACDLYQRNNDVSDMLDVLIYKGRAQMMLDQPQHALVTLKQAAQLSFNRSLVWQSVMLAEMAGAKQMLGEAGAAARLAGAASRHQAVMQQVQYPRIFLRDDYERILAEARRRLNTKTQSAWNDGASLSDADAVALAVRL